MSWIGVDFGDARVGLAVSDDACRMALPRETVATRDAVEAIVDLARDIEAKGIVVGWPLELNGREGRATERVRAFVEALEECATSRGLTLEILTRDERLTTSFAAALLDEVGVHGRKRKAVVDQLAAAKILQAFLDERSNGASSDAGSNADPSGEAGENPCGGGDGEGD